MKRKHLDFDKFLKDSLKNPKIKSEYDRLQPEFAVIEAIIQARRNHQLTQKELAQKIGTTQSAIARLESGKYNPSVEFLKKVAKALSSQLEIRFVPYC